MSGSAYGYLGKTSLFGGPEQTRGPEPAVTLPPNGSLTPLTASRSTGLVDHGPATFFSSGPIMVSTQGATGKSPPVTSSATIQDINTSGTEVFTASAASSGCRADGTSTSGSTSLTDGVLRTSEGANTSDPADDVYVNVPASPAPNTTYNGSIESAGDSFQYKFNEQVVNPDGSITVYAGHLRLLGPTAVGDVWWGKSECGASGTPIADNDGGGGGGGGDGDPAGGKQPDLTPPETLITKKKVKHSRDRAKFKFSSTELGSTYLCKRDRARFRPCISPVVYRKLKDGRHRFRVKAADAAGNVDPTPAKKRFRIH